MFEVELFDVEQLGAEDEDMDKKIDKKHVAQTIRRLDLMMGRNLEARVKEEGIDEMTRGYGWCMRYLYENRDKDIYQKDLEKQFGLCRSSVTNTIQVMEKKGYLKREMVEQDARLKKVVLTEKGVEHHKQMVSIIDGLNERTLQGITDEELESFFRVIDKLEANLIQQKEERQEGKE